MGGKIDEIVFVAADKIHNLLNRKSGLAWTSYSHTALPVSVFASGIGAKNFDGYYENTEVAGRIAKIMGVDFGFI